jgi:hypothetical protein
LFTQRKVISIYVPNLNNKCLVVLEIINLFMFMSLYICKYIWTFNTYMVQVSHFCMFWSTQCFYLNYTQDNIMIGFAKIWSWLATINTILNLKNKLGLFSILDTSMSIFKVLMKTTSRCFHFLKFEDFEWFVTRVMCYNVLIMY